MKRFVMISAAAAALIIVMFAVQTLSQKNTSKVNSFKESLVLEEKLEYKLALDKIRPFYEENKKSYVMNLRLGWLYYLNGIHDSSKIFYSNALALSKGAVEAMIGLTFPLSMLGEWEKIESLYNDILKLDPNNYTANLRLGQTYLTRKEYLTAKKYLDKVHSLYPGTYEPNLSLGWTYFYLANYEKAKELLTNAAMLNAQDSLAAEGLKLLK